MVTGTVLFLNAGTSTPLGRNLHEIEKDVSCSPRTSEVNGHPHLAPYKVQYLVTLDLRRVSINVAKTAKATARDRRTTLYRVSRYILQASRMCGGGRFIFSNSLVPR